MNGIIETLNVKKLMKQQNLPINETKVTQGVKSLSATLLNSINSLPFQSVNTNVQFDATLLKIFDRIAEIDNYTEDLVVTLNKSHNKTEDLEEKLDELIINYRYRKPQKEITDLAKILKIELVHPLMTKLFPNGLCGTKISKTQAIMQFFDYLIVKVAQGDTLMIRCHELKKLLNGGLIFSFLLRN